MIVQYYADSLGLSRPNLVALNQRYIYIFEKWLQKNVHEEVFVLNKAKGGLTSKEAFDMFKDDEGYLPKKRDVLIIHLGVCDCAPRPISKLLRDFISKLPSFLRIVIVNYLHKNRAKLLRMGLAHYLVDAPEFEKIVRNWLLEAVNDFKCIYVINIAPTNSEIESHSPGFSSSIKKYNMILANVVQGVNSKENGEVNNNKIVLIDIYNKIVNSKIKLEELIVKEDGHHITSKGNEIYAEELIKMESIRQGKLE